MEQKIDRMVEIFKALSDKNRLLILDMLSCGELCACDIIEGLNLTQPTISHHMKILQKANLINSRKEGKWIRYSLNLQVIKESTEFISILTSFKEDCICKNIKGNCND